MDLCIEKMLLRMKYMSIENDIKNLIQKACDYQGLYIERQIIHQTIFREKEPEVSNRIRILIDGLILITVERLKEPIENTNEKISYQISLIVSYVRTHYIITDHLMKGDLIEGIILVRKQLETVARLKEIEQKDLKKLHKKTPNIKNAIHSEACRIYGYLSEAAHFSTPDIASLLKINENGEKIGPSLVPDFQDIVFDIYNTNNYIDLCFLMFVVEKMKYLYPSIDNEKNTKLIGYLVLQMKEANIIEIPDHQ